ncbi:MAG: hypothetical protein ABSF14_07280 [Terriglobia bacterium]
MREAWFETSTSSGGPAAEPGVKNESGRITQKTPAWAAGRHRRVRHEADYFAATAIQRAVKMAASIPGYPAYRDYTLKLG